MFSAYPLVYSAEGCKGKGRIMESKYNTFRPHNGNQS